MLITINQNHHEVLSILKDILTFSLVYKININGANNLNIPAFYN